MHRARGGAYPLQLLLQGIDRRIFQLERNIVGVVPDTAPFHLKRMRLMRILCRLSP